MWKFIAQRSKSFMEAFLQLHLNQNDHLWAMMQVIESLNIDAKRPELYWIKDRKLSADGDHVTNVSIHWTRTVCLLAYLRCRCSASCGTACRTATRASILLSTTMRRRNFAPVSDARSAAVSAARRRPLQQPLQPRPRPPDPPQLTFAP